MISVCPVQTHTHTHIIIFIIGRGGVTNYIPLLDDPGKELLGIYYVLLTM